METIQTYLNNMFEHLPQTPEVLQAKEELYNMMEDKYNELKKEGKTENEAIGIVISEFGNLEEVAEELEINQYMKKGVSLEKNVNTDTTARVINLQEAKAFIDITVKSSFKIAIGVLLCICSPIYIILASMVDSGKNDIFMFWGILLLLIMICIGVSLFITSSINLDKYEFMKKEVFQIDTATTSYVKNEKNRFNPIFARSIAIGVGLCILSVVPPIGGSMIIDRYSGNSYGSIIGAALLLIIVAIGVFFFITSGMRKEAYEILLQEKEYLPEIKKRNSTLDKISPIYWTFITAIYLAWSFITFDWGRSWIIWPVAGVLYAGISSICNAMFTDKNNL